jgi:hypothetical protein
MALVVLLYESLQYPLEHLYFKNQNNPISMYTSFLIYQILIISFSS